MRSRLLLRLCHSLAVLAAASLLSTGIATAANPNLAAKGFYNSAVELANQGDYRGAVIQLKNVLQSDPGDLSARVLLGNIYLKTKDGASAVKELLRARRNGAQDRFILVPLGRAYLMQSQFKTVLKEIRTAGQDEQTAAKIAVIRGDAHYGLLQLDSAEKSYLQALVTHPQDDNALLGLARTKLALGDLVAARHYIGWALKANGDNARAWLAKAEIERVQRKNDDATVSFGQAIMLEPDLADALLGRASLRIETSRHSEAEPDVMKVRRLNPDDPRAAYLQARILAERGDMDQSGEALSDALLILKRYPGDFVRSHAPTMLLMGMVSYFAKNDDDAYRHLTRYLERVPHHDDARKILAAIALKRGETANALHLLNPLVPHYRDNLEFLILYSDALIKAKQISEATLTMDAATKIATPGSAALSRIVALRLAAEQHEQAIRLLDAEIARDPNAIKASLTVASIQMRRKNFGAALAAINRTLKRHPKNPTLHDLAGVALLALKKTDAARTSFTIALQLAPDYTPTIYNLGKLEGSVGNIAVARKLFSAILEKDPENGEVMLTLAGLHRSENDIDGAFRWLEKARTSSRQSAAATLSLITLSLATGRADAAVILAQNLHRQNPENLEFLAMLGRALHGAKDLERAADIFRQLADRAQEILSLKWLHTAGKWLRKVRDAGAARAALEKALKIDARFVGAHVELFGLDMATRNFSAAMRRAEKVAKIVPDQPVGDALKGDVYMQRRQFDKAANAYDSAFKKGATTATAAKNFHARRAVGQRRLKFVERWALENATDGEAQHLLAIAYADAGQLSKAVAIYQQQLKSSPDDAQLINNVALLYQKMGDSRALDLAKRAHDATPDHPLIMDTYGWVLVQGGQLDQGLRILRNARFRAPDLAEIRYHLAVALNQAGRPKEARRELEYGMALGQPFDGAKDARKLLTQLSR